MITDHINSQKTNGILLTTTPIGRNLFKIKQIRNMVLLWIYKYIRFNLVFARWCFHSDGPQKMMQLAVQFNYCLNAHVIFYCNLLQLSCTLVLFIFFVVCVCPILFFMISMFVFLSFSNLKFSSLCKYGILFEYSRKGCGKKFNGKFYYLFDSDFFFVA